MRLTAWRLPPTYPCPWRAGGGERAGARPGSPEGARVRRRGEQAGARVARGAPPCQFAADVAAHVAGDVGWTGTGQPGSRRRQRLDCNPPCLPRGAKGSVDGNPQGQDAGVPGLLLRFAHLRVCHSLGQAQSCGQAVGTKLLGKALGSGRVCRTGRLGADFSVFFASGSVAQAADPGYGDAGSGARWFAGRASAAGARFDRPPPTGFFVPGAFT
jgi:hypothetical protein